MIVHKTNYIPQWRQGWWSSPVIGSTIPATTVSTKKFKIAVTDDGTLTATEVTP